MPDYLVIVLRSLRPEKIIEAARRNGASSCVELSAVTYRLEVASIAMGHKITVESGAEVCQLIGSGWFASAILGV